MAYRVELSRRARTDLHDLYLSIGASGSEQTTAWFNGLALAISQLDLFPLRGAPVTDRPGLRRILYGRKPNIHRILHCVLEPTKTVTVVHIRHGARDAWVPDDEPGAA